MTPENKEHFLSKKEAIFLLLTGIGDDIYSTFTSRDGESMESYYSWFYKLMNELTRNNLQVTTMQVNVQFLQQLQPEWSDLDVHKGKEIAKPVTPQSESVSEEDSDPEQAQRDKDMQKNLALLAKYSTRLYKPTNNNLRTSSNSRNKMKIPHKETVGSQVVQQNGIQCFNCKGFGHYAKECRKPKRVKDYSDNDERDDETEMAAHYSFMAKIQEVLPEESSSTEQPLEQVQNNDENNVFANERQHSENNTAECADERVALANLIANLTL
ncbi:retrovirus-related pol polyprotein from transposon TNT 1-94 [Tanacetum coccineum]